MVKGGEVRETARRDCVTSGIREVLEVAHEGRVHKLLWEKDAEHEGLLGPLFPMDSARLVSSPIAAVLRYSD